MGPRGREMGPLGPQGPQGEGAVGGDFYCLGWRLYGVIFIGMGGFYWYGVTFIGSRPDFYWIEARVEYGVV